MCPPLAYTPLPVEGVIRSCPDDFFVDERAAFEPSHEGEHLLLRIEKRGLNTHAVATDLARFYGVAPGDVSFAGMKDRHAVTRQWFSVRTPSRCDTGDGDRLARGRVGATRPQTAAWRTGRQMRSVSACASCVDASTALPERIATLRRMGVPNYFGEQRFGRDAANVARAQSLGLSSTSAGGAAVPERAAPVDGARVAVQRGACATGGRR